MAKKDYDAPKFVETNTQDVDTTNDDFGKAIATQDLAAMLEEATEERDNLRRDLDKANAELADLREGIIRLNDQLTRARNEKASVEEQLRRSDTMLKDLRKRKADLVELLHFTRDELDDLKHRSLWERIINKGVK
jgi:chromosome segregation ATPase